MRWQKSVTDKYIADWRFFKLEGKSIGSMMLTGLIVGIVYGVLVAKIWPGLPGDAHRKMTNSISESVKENLKLHDKMCKDFPKSQACQQPPKGSNNASQIR